MKCTLVERGRGERRNEVDMHTFVLVSVREIGEETTDIGQRALDRYGA